MYANVRVRLIALELPSPNPPPPLIKKVAIWSTARSGFDCLYIDSRRVKTAINNTFLSGWVQYSDQYTACIVKYNNDVEYNHVL